MSEDLKVVGKRVPLLDAYQKVTGAIQFSNDIMLPGMLHAKVLKSPYAHAKILRIDTREAERLPGVKAVITYKDVSRRDWYDRDLNWTGPVMDEVARFVGDNVAVVVAEDAFIAEEALSLIEVDYEQLPAVFDIEEAMKPDAPKVRSDGNVRKPSIIEWGNVDRGFKEADFIFEHTTRMGQQQHAPVQRNACVASWINDELTVWTSTQQPFGTRDRMADYFEIPYNKVRVIALPCGGSFGLWWTNNYQFITAVAAKKAGRPVKYELTKEEAIATVKRRERPISYAKIGVKKDGKFVAIHFKHLFDNGAYGYKFDPYESVADMYPVPHGKFEMYGVSTHLFTGGCMRGVGDLTMNFCMEQLVDKAAEGLGMDPVEIRLKNHIRTGDPIRSHGPVGKLSSCGIEQCLRKGADTVGWKDKWKGWGKPVEVNGSKRRGIGVAIANHISGPGWVGSASIIVRINEDGTVHLETGVGRMGQGVETTQAQIVAEVLGVPIKNIVGAHGDTASCPWGPPTVGSINAHVTGRATKAAAEDARRQLFEFAAERLGVKQSDLMIEDSTIYVKNDPKKKITIKEIASTPPAGFPSAPQIIGRAWSTVPKDVIARMMMVHYAEVEVDTDTGEVSIVKYVAAHDSGKIINPSVCENQVAGGQMIGCGFALIEDLVFDQKTGRVLNPNYLDYKLLTALDLPDPEIIFVEPIDPIGAFGIKGIGEGSACPSPPAVAQAIHNAIGVRIDVPITPAKILRALGK